MISPKEKVRANIYKTLLEEEKRKNKKKTLFSLSLFVIGVFSGTSYTNIFQAKDTSYNKNISLNKNSEQIIDSKNKKNIEFGIDDLFQAEEMLEIGDVEFNFENLFVTELQI